MNNCKYGNSKDKTYDYGFDYVEAFTKHGLKVKVLENNQGYKVKGDNRTIIVKRYAFYRHLDSRTYLRIKKDIDGLGENYVISLVEIVNLVNKKASKPKKEHLIKPEKLIRV